MSWSKAVVLGMEDDRLVPRKCVSFDKKWIPRQQKSARRFRDAVSSSLNDVPEFISVVPSLEKENFWVQGRSIGGPKRSV